MVNVSVADAEHCKNCGHFYLLLRHPTNFFYYSNVKRNYIAPRAVKSVSIVDYSKEKGHTDGEVISIAEGDNVDDALVICFYAVV